MANCRWKYQCEYPDFLAIALTGRVSNMWASIQSTIPCTTGIIFGLTTSSVLFIVNILLVTFVGWLYLSYKYENRQ